MLEKSIKEDLQMGLGPDLKRNKKERKNASKDIFYWIVLANKQTLVDL